MSHNAQKVHRRHAGAPAGSQNRHTHGSFTPTLRPEGLAEIQACAGDNTLVEEIAQVRIVLRRLLALLNGDPDALGPVVPDAPLTPELYARLATLALAGACTLARLIRVNSGLSAQAADKVSAEAQDWLSGKETERISADEARVIAHVIAHVVDELTA
jgi:hypothetical protein